MITSQDGTTSLNPEAGWSKDEKNEALSSDKALNSIFNGVDMNMFILINICIESKEAWEILKTSHEGISNVRMLRLQLLTAKFENLRMMEDEPISEFNICFCDIANNSFVLG